ncbi:MAG: diguanylate cyclase [Pseudomonadales bacterium]
MRSQPIEFFQRISMYLAIVCIVVLTPFAINNFAQGRTSIGIGASAIIGFFAFNAYSISILKKYYPSLTLLALMPAVVAFLISALASQGIIGALWCYPAVIAFYFMLPERKAWLANGVILASIFPVIWASFDPGLATRIIATLGIISILSVVFIRVINEQQIQLREQAITDPLTGVLNRKLLQASLEDAVEQSKRAGLPMTLISLDLDYFKNINDTHGHDAGDEVLRAVGEVLRTRCRKVDRVFRLGGEEFLVLLYNSTAENGLGTAEDLRQAVAGLESPDDSPVTISAGVACLQPNEDWQGWMKRSDTKVYEAKKAGRNQVASCDSI